jgi:hypothetical protein
VREILWLTGSDWTQVGYACSGHFGRRDDRSVMSA